MAAWRRSLARAPGGREGSSAWRGRRPDVLKLRVASQARIVSRDDMRREGGSIGAHEAERRAITLRASSAAARDSAGENARSPSSKARCA